METPCAAAEGPGGAPRPALLLSLSVRSIRLPQSSCQLLLRQAHVTRCNLSHQIRNTTRTHTHSHTHRHVHTHTDTRNKHSDLALCAWYFIEIRVASIKGRIQMLFLLFPDIAASLTRVKWSVVLFTQRDKKIKKITSCPLAAESFPIPHGSHGTAPPWKLYFFSSRLYGAIPRAPADSVLRNGANGHVLARCLSVHTSTLLRQFCHR